MTMPSRLPDWEQRLNAFLESRREAVFSYGPNDCAKFCAFAIEAVTGVYPIDFDWQTEEEAMALLEKYGTMKKAVSSILGRSKGVLCARRGDIVIQKNGALGVCIGSKVATPHRTGLIFLPLSSFERSWRVG